jgi:mutator protein MutT
MRLSTIVFLTRDHEVLLGRKKRGLGAGRWNGYGGKIEPGETPMESAVRETREELCVTPRDLSYRAELKFEYVDGPAWRSHVFVSSKWSGEPAETEEMAPAWFPIAELPLTEMWDDDAYWLRRVLAGERLAGEFRFDGNQRVIWHHLKPMRRANLDAGTPQLQT